MKQSAISYRPPISCKVYTPIALADAMIMAVAGAADNTWLEPSFGRGVFLRELNRIGVAKSKITAVDLELNPSPNDIYATTLRGQDFLDWARETKKRFDRVVANPPYVSLLDLPQRARATARMLALPASKEGLPARSNLWAAFILGAVRTLNEGGAMAFVLPAAWDYADYARELREELPKLFADWYCFRCEEPLFPDVSEGSVVIVGKGFGQRPVNNLRVSCLSVNDLVAQLRRLGGADQTQVPPLPTRRLAVWNGLQRKLSDLIEIRLGGVTGDVNYFLMRESERLEHKLPEFALKPVLSKAGHLQCSIINRAVWDKLRNQDARVWLFRPAQAHLTHAMVRRYIRLDAKKGGCNRSAEKIQNREPWYQVPLPNAVAGFVSGMSNAGPWIALNAMSQLTATNTLYTVRFKGRMTLIDKASLALALLSSPVREQLPNVCRRYAAGLAKFEPSDLQNLNIPGFTVSAKAPAAYEQAVKALLNGSAHSAAVIADRCLGF